MKLDSKSSPIYILNEVTLWLCLQKSTNYLGSHQWEWAEIFYRPDGADKYVSKFVFLSQCPFGQGHRPKSNNLFSHFMWAQYWTQCLVGQGPRAFSTILQGILLKYFNIGWLWAQDLQVSVYLNLTHALSHSATMVGILFYFYVQVFPGIEPFRHIFILLYDICFDWNTSWILCVKHFTG